MIAVDCETCDPLLKENGPGWHRDDTFIAGVAIGTEDGFRRYYGWEHEGGGNVEDPDKCKRWLKHELSRADQPKVGAHLLYDIGYLGEYGIEVKGPCYDVQNAEPLLDENAFNYKLERLSQKYLGIGKIDDELDEYLKAHYGKKNPKGNIWRAPADIVSPYGIGDVNHPLEIFKKQKPLLEQQGLWDLFLLETNLIPILHRMRKRAVRVDLDKAEQMRTRFNDKKAEVHAKIRHMTGLDVAVWAADSIAPAFDEIGIRYPLTPKTQKPSFTKGFLEMAAELHELPRLILEERRLDKMVGTFLEGCILNAHVNGRVYAQFHQQKSDEGGTTTGRFSSSDPNLQFIPARTEDGKLIRSIFIPDEGREWWKVDYSQIEYRLMAHDASGLRLRGAEDVVRRYIEDPDTDFHTAVAELVYGKEKAKLPQYRGFAKTINFGIAYGEGEDKLSRSLGVSKEEGARIIAEYHRRAPFMRPLAEGCSNLAKGNGEIETLFGRKRRFPWGKTIRNRETGERSVQIVPHRIPGATRVFTHKALNARIQGSAADIMKEAMVQLERDGVVSDGGPIGIFQLTVHDELDGSFENSRRGLEALRHIKDVMENVVRLRVPLRVDLSSGKNWGEVKDWVDGQPVRRAA